MQIAQYHVFACEQRKPEGIPSCSACGSKKVIEHLRAEVTSQGLQDRVQITTCGSLGLCESGPNMVVYPEGTWYGGVTPGDVPELVREHFGHGRPLARLVRTEAPAIRAEMETNRKRRLAAMRAQDAAGVIPHEFQQQVRAFRESRVVLTAIELDVFSHTGDGRTADQIADKIGCDPRATEMLLNALTSLGLLEKKTGGFRNGPLAARYLAAGGKDDSRLGLMHTVHLWDRWTTLTECVRKGTSVTYKPMADRDDDRRRAFIGAMHKNASSRAAQVVAAVGVGGVRRLLDIGGGSGAYSIAFAQADPDLQATIFDLPPVLPLTEKYTAEAGLTGRIRFQAGDMNEDEFGNGYDLVLLCAICHMNSPEQNRSLFKKCLSALAPGGRLVIQDFILEPDKTAPRSGALFALNMLVATRVGSSYSRDEYMDWLTGAGFQRPKHIRLPGPTGLVIATRS
jgi:(2Fe-2S) ferredoxin/SAM-dependent methyltransferase/DNA-binding CsgD family transcriptional regulator